MLDQATKNWVKSHMASGYTRQQLESILRQKHYSEEDIKSAFATAGKASAAGTNGTGTGTTGASPAGAKPKGNMMGLVLAGLFFFLFVGAAIFAYSKMSEVDDVKFAMTDLEMTARSEKLQLEQEKTDLESQLANMTSSHSMELAEKDDKITELEARIADLEDQIKILETQQTVENPAETEMTDINEEPLSANETSGNDITGNETTENATELPEEYQGYADNPAPIYTNETQQMFFPNETVDYDLSQDMWLPVYVFNPDYEEQYMQVRITCKDLYEEQFTLAKTDCDWVGPRSEKEFQVYLPAYGSPVSARLDCYMEQYNADMACEEPVRGLVQKSFSMDIFDLSE